MGGMVSVVGGQAAVRPDHPAGIAEPNVDPLRGLDLPALAGE